MIERGFHVVRRARDVGRVWSGLAIDCAAVNDFPLWIDDDHVRCVLCTVSAACVAFGIQQQRGLMRLPRRRDLRGLFSRQVALRTWRIGINGQPDNAFVSEFLLQVLHVAAAIVLLHKRALRIKPFEHDVFALVLRKRMSRTFRVCQRKIGRGASNRRRISGKDCGSDQ